jgi:hypothetical protein
MNDSLLLPIILQLVGVVVIIAEIILPSGGILSIVALGVFGYSLFIVFNEISMTIGFSFVAADLILIPVLVIVGLKLLARSPVTLRQTLSRKEGVSSHCWPDRRLHFAKHYPGKRVFPPNLPSWKAMLVRREMRSRTFVLRE